MGNKHILVWHIAFLDEHQVYWPRLQTRKREHQRIKIFQGLLTIHHHYFVGIGITTDQGKRTALLMKNSKLV